jgi:hypothetical protein
MFLLSRVILRAELGAFVARRPTSVVHTVAISYACSRHLSREACWRRPGLAFPLHSRTGRQGCHAADAAQCQPPARGVASLCCKGDKASANVRTLNSSIRVSHCPLRQPAMTRGRALIEVAKLNRLGRSRRAAGGISPGELPSVLATTTLP